jgi:diadenosine tetraphosphatase ApaH/serine/threonine PP2A family protein phosphatase
MRSIDDFMLAFGDLSSEAHRIISAQPIVSRLHPPCKVFGDIQGGFRELLLLFNHSGFPSDNGGDIETCSYIFNGNFVDVGLHQIEVVCLLLALKVLYPSRIWLNRGNHEFREQNCGEFGFQACCSKMFLDSNDGSKIFDVAHSIFDWLPIAAVIAGSIFVCHGGISHDQGQWHLEDLLLLHKHRPIRNWTHKNYPNILLQLLWSNPDDAHVDSNKSVCSQVWHVERKVGDKRPVEFTQNHTDAFMERNSIQLVIRSHQVPKLGACFHHKGKILTVFSAKNYNGTCANLGAVVLVCSNADGEISCRIKTTQ